MEEKQFHAPLGAAGRVVSCLMASSLAFLSVPSAAIAATAQAAAGGGSTYTLRATQEVTVGDLKYRIDTSAKTATVIDFANYSSRPDDLIIPEKIEVGGVAYTVTVIGDADDVSAGQICGKKSLTIPATVVKLEGIPFESEGAYYFLGAAPNIEDVFYQMWGGMDTLDGDLYCQSSYIMDSSNGDSFNDWENSYSCIYYYDTFVAPTSLTLADADGADQTGKTIEAPAGRVYTLTATNQPAVSASSFVAAHTKVTWASSDTSVATVDASTGQVTMVAGAAAGATATITATNAIGQSASVTAKVAAAAKKSIAGLEYAPDAIDDMYITAIAKPAITVKDGAYTLVDGSDYTVSYEKGDGTALASFDEVNLVGDYKVVFIGAGDAYEGSFSIAFKVVDELSYGDWKYKLDADGKARITGYTGAKTSLTSLVVPGKLAGIEVASIASGALDGVKMSTAWSARVVVPDTVTSIDADAFANMTAKKFKFLGAAPAVNAGSTIALPSGASVYYFGDYTKRSFAKSFGTTPTYTEIAETDGYNKTPEQLWAYRLELSGDKNSPTKTGLIVSADEKCGYRGTIDDQTVLSIPASIDGVSISGLGEWAIYGENGALSVGLLDVPATIVEIGYCALDGLSGLVRFGGEMPVAASGVGDTSKASIWYPNTQTASWKTCAWKGFKAANTYDPAWTMDYKPATKTWTVKGWANKTGALALPEKYCTSSSANVDLVAWGAFSDCSGYTSITIPANITGITPKAFQKLACEVTFAGAPPAEVTGTNKSDYKTEFTDSSMYTATKQWLRYPVKYAAEWEASGWVAKKNYNIKVYGACDPANYVYEKTADGEYTITSYKGGSGTSIEIPSTLDGYEIELKDGTKETVASGKVVAIGAGALSSTNGMPTLSITDIVIPSTVKSIGEAAFQGNRKLNNLLIQGEGLESIGHFAISGSALQTVNLPKSVNNIAAGAFMSAVVQNVFVADGCAAYTSVDGVLYTADMKTLHTYPMGRDADSYTVVDGVTKVEEEAFRCDPNSTRVNEHGVKQVVLPESVTEIGWAAFRYAKDLEKVNLPESATTLGTYVFDCCYKLADTNLPSTITEIPDGFYYGCEALQGVDIPATVTRIGEYAFDRVPLSEIALPEGLVSIGQKAFENTKLAKVEFPKSVTTVGDHAFYSIDELAEIEFAEDGALASIGIGCFAQSGELTQIEIPNTVVEVGNAAFGTCSKLTSVTFEDGCQLEEIAPGMFQNDALITEITIPDCVTSVGSLAFWNCLGLKGVDGGKVVFLNQGEWELSENAFTYGYTYDSLEIDAYGYKSSSTATNFDAEHFFPIDVTTTLPATMDATSGLPLNLKSGAETENGDLSFSWTLDGEKIADATRKDQQIRFMKPGTYEVAVLVTNSYDPTHPTTATCTVTVTGEDLSLVDIAQAEVEAVADQTATGKPICPQPAVVYDGKTLEKGTDYELSYKNNVEPGTATIVIAGKGDFTGTKTVNFAILDNQLWKRLAGNDALGTMKAIVDAGWESSEWAVVATNKSYHDALAAAGVAGLLEAPVLTTAPASLSKQTRTILASKNVKKVLVVGGVSAVSENVEKQLKAMGLAVQRVAGNTAVGTANKVYNFGKTLNGGWGSDAIVATSSSFQDALSIAPYAYAKKVPIFLTGGKDGTLTDASAKAIKAGKFTRTIIVGGEAAVPKSVERQVTGATRVAGNTAYGTNKKVVDFAISQGMSAAHMGVATGRSYYDALAGAALCGKQNSILVLADDKNSNNIDKVVKVRKDALVPNCYIFGGKAALSESVEKKLEAASK